MSETWLLLILTWFDPIDISVYVQTQNYRPTIQLFLFMLAVHPQSISEPKLESQTIEQEPSLSEVDVTQPKQIIKRKIFTPVNIIIVLAVVALGVSLYYLLSLNADKEITNQINLNEGKIITYADSSKKEGSNSGSSSSKSSNSNNKPTPRSHPASRGTISSNPGLTGSGAPDGDDEQEDGDESKKKQSTTDASSFEQDSDQQEEEQDEMTEPTYWVDSKQKGVNVGASSDTPPMVGNARDSN